MVKNLLMPVARLALGCIGLGYLTACGGGDEAGPPPATVAGTWTSSLLTVTLSQSGSGLSGSGTFRDAGGGTCNFPLSGSYDGGAVSLGMGSTIICSGQFSGNATSSKLEGSLSFSYAADASQPRHRTDTEVVLSRQ